MSVLRGLLIFSGFFFISAAPAAEFSDYSGEELYQRFCASCHGVAAEGDGPVAASLSVEVPDLTGLYRRHGNKFPAQKVREIVDGRSVVVAHGTRYMPVWGYELWVEAGADSEAEMQTRGMLERLVDYLRQRQR
jgi:mono/diheme cytochrome c family protein